MSPSTNTTRRRLGLGQKLLAAVGAAGADWYWNQRVHAPDPGIVIRTEAAAVEGARKFLAAAHVSTSGYDLSRTSGITRDRLKGQVLWRNAAASWLETLPMGSSRDAAIGEFTHQRLRLAYYWGRELSGVSAHGAFDRGGFAFPTGGRLVDGLFLVTLVTNCTDFPSRRIGHLGHVAFYSPVGTNQFGDQ